MLEPTCALVERRSVVFEPPRGIRESSQAENWEERASICAEILSERRVKSSKLEKSRYRGCRRDMRAVKLNSGKEKVACWVPSQKA